MVSGTQPHVGKPLLGDTAPKKSHRCRHPRVPIRAVSTSELGGGRGSGLAPLLSLLEADGARGEGCPRLVEHQMLAVSLGLQLSLVCPPRSGVDEVSSLDHCQGLWEGGQALCGLEGLLEELLVIHHSPDQPDPLRLLRGAGVAQRDEPHGLGAAHQPRQHPGHQKTRTSSGRLPWPMLHLRRPPCA